MILLFRIFPAAVIRNQLRNLEKLLYAAAGCSLDPALGYNSLFAALQEMKDLLARNESTNVFWIDEKLKTITVTDKAGNQTKIW